MKHKTITSTVLACLLVVVGKGIYSQPSPPSGPAHLEDRGTQVVLSNGVVSVTVNKSTGTIPEMHLGDSPNLAGRGAYLAVANSGGHDGWDVKNAVYREIRNTPDLVEVAFDAPIGGVHFSQHYVLRRGDSGFHVFIDQSHGKADPPEKFGQTRWSFYLNPKLFDYQLVNDKVQAPIPDLKGAQAVQDATYRLADGSVYTKYNYADYVEEHYLHGLCGSSPGSYGVFFIMGSNEYLGAPTKQYLTVHSGPIIHRFLHSGHFLPREIAHPDLPDGWSKVCGPWFVYLNRGDTPGQMWQDAKTRTAIERAAWPYSWMNDPGYPLERGTVSGSLKVSQGAKSRPARNALMVLTTPGADWQVQILDYNFSTRADANGRFNLTKVRPGTYTLFAAIPGTTETFHKENIIVKAGGATDLGVLEFKPNSYYAHLWQIGYPDYKTTGFKLSDQPRQYGLDKTVPADLTFTMGKSVEANDWYYAQAKPGDWNVQFKVDKSYKGDGVITIAIAGQTSDPRLDLLINNTPIGTISAGNSSAAYRSAILSSSYYETRTIRFPASLLKKGANLLTMRLKKGCIMYDCLELDVDHK